MAANFRVTVQDLDTGQSRTVETHLGDYLLIPFGDCRLAATKKVGTTHVLTVKNCKPEGPIVEVSNG